VLNTVQKIQASPTNTFGLMATPAVDLTPTGHLPYLVGQPDTAREHPETTTAEPNTSPLAGLSIVTALVGGNMVPVACPTRFCTESHTSENTGHLADVSHTGTTVDVYAPGFQGGFDELFAYAHLVQDPYSKDAKERAAYIRVEDGGGEESPLTPDQADTFADNLTVFAGQIRTLAQVARATGEPATESGSLKHSRTPFTDSEDKQTASAAFDLATRAIDVALAKSGDQAVTLRALRSFLDMAEAEQA
jgi:hypothetical protein